MRFPGKLQLTLHQVGRKAAVAGRRLFSHSLPIYSSEWLSMKRSQSMAAMQPEAAAVTACR